MSQQKQIALVGVGPMAALHAKTIAEVPGINIAYCVSRSQDKADAFAAEHGIARGRTFDDMMHAPEVDALWVVAPADVMAPVATALNALGLPMFLEKPVGLDPIETRAVCDAVTVPTMVGLNRRFYEVIQWGLGEIEKAGGARMLEVHMPEAGDYLPDSQSARTQANWQYANSVHLIDLLRLYGGETTNVTTFNQVQGQGDRSYLAVADFDGGARGLYNAQWYAPGGWRFAAYADDLCLVFQPVESVQVFRRGKPLETVTPTGPDSHLKAGLFGQAEAFSGLLSTGILPASAADLNEYLQSVELVAKLTAEQTN